ncbi:hypothetical protein EIP91_006005 [Steccherinum ochraceum]|uniref:AMP-dependent synthetase/ligase domain-containing protein n=1 Tax=Steccherinum ochraceum TaxID=92696 RepID=A0A4R0R6E9_9APHY|nr:hypothetical protein EIP91_006005 [Steccherinum ochraceum]
MASFPLDIAQLVALFVESVLYGAFLMTFGMCVHALWNSQLSGSSQKRMFIAVALLLFLFATSDVAFGLRHLIDAFIYYRGSGGAIQELSDIAYWVNVMKAINYSCQTSIADWVMIYRCYILYGRSWKVIAALIVLWLAGIVSEVFSCFSEFTEHRATNLNSDRLTPWLTSTLAVTMTLNVIATGLIVYRIWSVERSSTGMIIYSRGSSERQGSALKRAMRIIIESGALYTVSVFLFFVTFLAKHNAQYATSDAVVQVIGIAFNMIIIRISQRRSVDASGVESRYNTMPFFSSTKHGRRGGGQETILAGISVDIAVESDMRISKDLPILESLNTFGPSPLFKKLIRSDGHYAWDTITYADFASDMERSAAYWSTKLGDGGMRPQQVVGLWISGSHYEDLVLVYAVCRAGFVPEVFSSSFQDQGAPVLQELLNKTGGQALLFDPQYSEAVKGITVPCIPIPEMRTIPPSPSSLPSLPDVDEADKAMIFHTSGTTSGKPKPVPESHRWLRCQRDIQWSGSWQGEFEGQDVFNNIGIFANVGTATTINYLTLSGQCLAQTSRSDFGRDELLALVHECGLNRMFLYVPWFTNLLDIARKDEVVLNALKGMRQICYTGASLNPEQEAWIMKEKIPATAMYASTEIAPSLVSDLDKLNKLPLMRVLPGLTLKFVETGGLRPNDVDSGSDSRSGGGELLELFVPITSPNCPHPDIRNRPDGHYTGDLFEEVEEGYYAFRGRSDDWIRTGPDLLFCDTKSIEDTVMLKCADLVKTCTVVGHYKPALILFVEPQPGAAVTTPSEETALKDRILGCMTKFNARLFSHERIADINHIVIVPTGSLDRGGEKSSIRRKTVEEKNKETLDTIYGLNRLT